MQKPGVEILYLVFAADATGKLRSTTARKSKTFFHDETHNIHKIQEKEEKQEENFSCVSWLGKEREKCTWLSSPFAIPPGMRARLMIRIPTDRCSAHPGQMLLEEFLV